MQNLYAIRCTNCKTLLPPSFKIVRYTRWLRMPVVKCPTCRKELVIQSHVARGICPLCQGYIPRFKIVGKTPISRTLVFECPSCRGKVFIPSLMTWRWGLLSVGLFMVVWLGGWFTAIIGLEHVITNMLNYKEFSAEPIEVAMGLIFFIIAWFVTNWFFYVLGYRLGTRRFIPFKGKKLLPCRDEWYEIT